jgi:hypothetical protein
MTEKHHMDQNSYMSLLCPKPRVVSDNMTRGDDVAKSPGPTDMGREPTLKSLWCIGVLAYRDYPTTLPQSG